MVAAPAVIDVVIATHEAPLPADADYETATLATAPSVPILPAKTTNSAAVPQQEPASTVPLNIVVASVANLVSIKVLAATVVTV